MSDAFSQVLSKESPFTETWTPRLTAFDPRRRYFYYSNNIKEITDRSNIQWKKKIKVQYVALEAESYAVPVNSPHFSELALYTVHLYGTVRSMDAKEDVQPTTLLQDAAKARMAAAGGKTTSNGGSKTGSRENTFTADDIYLSPLHPSKHRKLAPHHKSHEEKVDKWTFRASSYENFEQFVRRVRKCLVIHGCMPSLNAGMPAYDPRNGLYFGLVPLYLMSHFRMLRDVVFYSLQPGLLLMMNAGDRKVFGLGSYLCISHEMVMCLKASGKCPRWATISEISAVQYSLDAKRPFISILTRGNRPDILFTPVADPFPKSARATFDPAEAVRRIKNILETLLSNAYKRHQSDMEKNVQKAPRGKVPAIHNQELYTASAAGQQPGQSQSQPEYMRRINPNNISFQIPDNAVGMPPITEVSQFPSVFNYIRENGAGRPMKWNNPSKVENQMVRLVSKQLLANALGYRDGLSQIAPGLIRQMTTSGDLTEEQSSAFANVANSHHGVSKVDRKAKREEAAAADKASGMDGEDALFCQSNIDQMQRGISVMHSNGANGTGAAAAVGGNAKGIPVSHKPGGERIGLGTSAVEEQFMEAERRAEAELEKHGHAVSSFPGSPTVATVPLNRQFPPSATTEKGGKGAIASTAGPQSPAVDDFLDDCFVPNSKRSATNTTDDVVGAAIDFSGVEEEEEFDDDLDGFDDEDLSDNGCDIAISAPQKPKSPHTRVGALVDADHMKSEHLLYQRSTTFVMNDDSFASSSSSRSEKSSSTGSDIPGIPNRSIHDGTY